MPRIRIPPTLRPDTENRREIDVAGHTVRHALESLVETYPSLAGRVLDDGGQLPPFINLYVDGTDVNVLGGLDSPIQPSSTLLLLPAMAGG